MCIRDRVGDLHIGALNVHGRAPLSLSCRAGVSARTVLWQHWQPLFKVWQELCSAIDEKYDMERLWNTGDVYKRQELYQSRRGFVHNLQAQAHKHENDGKQCFPAKQFGIPWSIVRKL